MTTVRDLEHKKNHYLVQVDHEVQDIQRDYTDLPLEDYFPYLVVELDNTKTEIIRIWGLDSCNLDSYALLIHTTQFNKREVNQK